RRAGREAPRWSGRRRNPRDHRQICRAESRAAARRDFLYRCRRDARRDRYPAPARLVPGARHGEAGSTRRSSFRQALCHPARTPVDCSDKYVRGEDYVMRLRRLSIAGVIALLALPAIAATKTTPKPEAKAETPKLFTLTSPTLKDNAMLPAKYA